MLISLIATTALTYRGKAVAEGELFHAPPIEALALNYAKQAMFAPRRLQRPDIEPEPPPAVVEPTVAPKPRRRYRRRDLQADDT
jgi:hypothetical protein